MRKAEQEQEDCGHAVYRIGCSVCIRGRCVEKHCRIEPLKEEEKGAKLPLVSFNHVLSTQEKADMFSILIRRMIPETLCSWEPTLEERGGFLGMTTKQMFTEDVVWIASPRFVQMRSGHKEELTEEIDEAGIGKVSGD